MQTFADLATDASMQMFASMGVVGLGPAKTSLMPVNATTNYYVGAPIDFVTRAHKFNMEVTARAACALPLLAPRPCSPFGGDH